MVLNCIVTVQFGQQLVTYVSGDSWANVLTPAYMQMAGPMTSQQLYWIAELDFTDGNWLNLTQPWPGASSMNLPVTIVTDYTPNMNLPLANPGDVNMVDLWNRAMVLLDVRTTAVPLHGPTHVGTGLDPIPLATVSSSGLLGQISGNATDYVGGDGNCYPLHGTPTGSVILFAGNSAPPNWLWCDGSAQSRAVYANLYAALGGAGSPWGQGDGVNTFNLPDLRGRVPMGAGAAPGLSNRPLGQKLGEENHILQLTEIPGHTHPYAYDQHAATGGTLGFGTGTYKLTLGAPANTGNAGGTGPGNPASGHNNIQPSAVINYIIRV